MSDLSLGWFETPTMNLLSLGKRLAPNSDVIYAIGSDPGLAQLMLLCMSRESSLGNSMSGGRRASTFMPACSSTTIT